MMPDNHLPPGSPKRACFSLSLRTRKQDKGVCLDAAVSAYVKVSKEHAAALIDFGAVYVQGRIARSPSMVLSGEEAITVNFPRGGIRKFYEIDPARIIYRDSFLFAYDKEEGIPSQQVPYDAYNNVFAALLRLLSGEGSSNCYAALHNRLDLGASGVLLFALEKKINESLGRAFQERLAKKEYLAWIEGSPRDDLWTSEANIGKKGGKYSAVQEGAGKQAQTMFRVLRRDDARSLVLAVPLTGRTHQIRIHLAEASHPISGDRSYGAKPDARLYLHAWRLTLKHPVSRKLITLEAPIPCSFGEVKI